MSDDWNILLHYLFLLQMFFSSDSGQSYYPLKEAIDCLSCGEKVRRVHMTIIIIIIIIIIIRLLFVPIGQSLS